MSLRLTDLIASCPEPSAEIVAPVGTGGESLRFTRPRNIVDFRQVKAAAEAWAKTARAKLTKPKEARQRNACGELDPETLAECYVLGHYLIDDGPDSIADRAYSFCILAAENAQLFNTLWFAFSMAWIQDGSAPILEAQTEGKDGSPGTSGGE